MAPFTSQSNDTSKILLSTNRRSTLYNFGATEAAYYQWDLKNRDVNPDQSAILTIYHRSNWSPE
jgi:hypothetical protein